MRKFLRWVILAAFSAGLCVGFAQRWRTVLGTIGFLLSFFGVLYNLCAAPPSVRDACPVAMQNPPWNIVFLIGFIVYVGIRGVFERRTRGNEKAVCRMDGRDRSLIFIVLMGSLLLPVVYLFTPWLAFADYRLPALFPWCGTAVMGAALWLFWRSHTDLGQNWSITLELRKGHQLVKHGVYRSIRHPMYASIWLFGLAQGLLLQNWLAGWSAFVTFALMYFVRTPREESMMCEFFGEEYRDYMRQTARLFPRIHRKNDEYHSAGANEQGGHNHAGKAESQSPGS